MRLKSETREMIKALTISGILIAFACYLFRYIGEVLQIAGILRKTLTPFLFGGFIAFMLLPLRKRIENIWLYRVNLSRGQKRFIAVAVSIIVFLAGITFVLLLLMPQLIESATTLANSMGEYVGSVEELYRRIFSSAGNGPVTELIFDSLGQATQTLSDTLTNILSEVVSYSVQLVSGVFKFFVAVIIAVYLLADSERFAAQVRDVIRAFLPDSQAKTVLYIGSLTRQMLNSFIFGKAIDSMIVGLICGVCTSLLKIPYAMLISFIVGLTNLIPVFGPFIGAIPSIFILIFINPWKALEFAVFILILQQVDGNIIGPHILGDSMGLPPLWIMFAIIVGGEFFSIAGMFFGVPFFAVVYVLIKDKVHQTLREKKEESIEKGSA